MRILFLHHFDLLLTGGSGVYLKVLVSTLRRRGHSVDVVAAREADLCGTKTWPLPFPFVLTFGPEVRSGEVCFDELSDAEIERLAEEAFVWLEREFRWDLILVNHISILARTALLLKRRFGRPFKIISYGTDTQLLMRSERYVSLFGSAAKAAERILTISHLVADEVLKTFPLDNVEPLGGAVDTSVFFPAKDIPLPDATAMFMGRLVTEKGLWVLLEALKIQQALEDFFLVGEGPLGIDLRKKVEQEEFDVRIHITGYIPQSGLRGFLLRSGALIVPSTWPEPLGLVSMEALACGIPVIASAVGGIPEVVTHRKNGLLVEPGNPKALAKAIDDFFGDEPLRRRLIRGCLDETRIPTYDDIAKRIIRDTAEEN